MGLSLDADCDELRRAATNLIWFARRGNRDSTVENVYLDQLEAALERDSPHPSPKEDPCK